jgi:hypothetical protein
MMPGALQHSIRTLSSPALTRAAAEPGRHGFVDYQGHEVAW